MNNITLPGLTLAEAGKYTLEVFAHSNSHQRSRFGLHVSVKGQSFEKGSHHKQNLALLLKGIFPQ